MRRAINLYHIGSTSLKVSNQRTMLSSAKGILFWIVA